MLEHSCDYAIMVFGEFQQNVMSELLQKRLYSFTGSKQENVIKCTYKKEVSVYTRVDMVKYVVMKT